jgi:hypothetical protein
VKNKYYPKTIKTRLAARIFGSMLSFICLFILISESIMKYGKSLIWQSYVMSETVIIIIYFQYDFEKIAKSQYEKN